MDLVDKNNEVLRSPATEVLVADIPALVQTIEEMFSILKITGGVGLAAPQVGIGKSLFVINIDGKQIAFINPAILDSAEEVIIEPEGCLSLPGITLKIPRPAHVTVTWLDETANQNVATLEGLLARCFLHEYDHLQGILIDNRVSKLELALATRRMLKNQRKLRR